MANYRQKRLFGRRAGRTLNKAQKEAMEEIFPSLSLAPKDLPEDGGLTPSSLFNARYKHYAYEIGFGTGEHLARLMVQNPDTGYFGAEPFTNGMATFCKQIKEIENKNVRLLMDDAMYLARSLQNESLDRIYVLNPDPWHKKRHHKRRIINQDNLDHFARILKPGGLLISSTDVPDLAEWIVTQISVHGAFEWQANNCKDWKTQPEWWPDHKYATKGAKGASQMHYFIFSRI